MLADFIDSNRERILALTRERVVSRESPKASAVELRHGIPLFLEQLTEALRRAESSPDITFHAGIGETAGHHGQVLLRLGLTIGQVVHDYGDVCQAVTELAVEHHVAIASDEFRTLNLCLDDAIAGAVTEFSRQRERDIAAQSTERLGVLAHEMRDLLNTATLSFEIIRRGQVSPAGSTGLVHSRSLLGLRDLIDRSLTAVRLEKGITHVEPIGVAELLAEVEIGASLQAKDRGVSLHVGSVDRATYVEADRQVLSAAIANLLHNAFKFTREGTHVTLSVQTTGDRVLIDVADECGGLPPGKAEELFRPFEQRGADRSGAGLGLAICRNAAKASNGELRVRDVPGKGCVFTLDLPRKPPPPLAVIDGGKSNPGKPGAREGSSFRDANASSMGAR